MRQSRVISQKTQLETSLFNKVSVLKGLAVIQPASKALNFNVLLPLLHYNQHSSLLDHAVLQCKAPVISYGREDKRETYFMVPDSVQCPV